MNEAEHRATIKSLLPRMKSAWGTDAIVLGPTSILVVVDDGHAGNIPGVLHSIPVEIVDEIPGQEEKAA